MIYEFINFFKMARIFLIVGSLMPLAGKTQTNDDIASTRVKELFYTNGAKLPATWEGDIKLVTLFQNSEKPEIIKAAIDYTEFLALIAGRKTENVNVIDKGFDSGLIIVVDDFEIHNDIISSDIFTNSVNAEIQKLINSKIVRYHKRGAKEGNNCLLIHDGSFANDQYLLRNAIIFVRDNLSYSEAEVCVYSKIAMTFGLDAGTFETDRLRNRRAMRGVDFGLRPVFLELYSMCMETNRGILYQCISKSFLHRFGVLIDGLTAVR